MEITRVKMNPEQAVLSCCNQPGKVMVTDSFNPWPAQCVMGYPTAVCPGAEGSIGQSS